MYTFNPIPAVPVDHTGFILVCFFCAIVMVVCLMNEPEAFFVWFFVITIICGVAYGVSYHWTSQETKTFVNEKHTGKFVGYQPEGYNEKSGKSRADRHYMYVVYEVNGGLVILKASEGQTYPKEAVLYKN